VLPKRAIIAAAAATSGVLLAATLWIGSWAYDARRLTLHDARLRKVLLQAPSAERLSRGLADEGSPLLFATRDQQEMRAAADRWGGRRAADIAGRAARFSAMRVHQVGDVTYFLFFDADGILKDYVCVA
jgi:hypothetical protein